MNDLFKKALLNCFKDKNDERTLYIKAEDIFVPVYNENKQEVFFVKCNEWCKSESSFIVSENKEGFQCLHCGAFYMFCGKTMHIKRWDLPAS